MKAPVRLLAAVEMVVQVHPGTYLYIYIYMYSYMCVCVHTHASHVAC